ncbi:MAG TPA: PDGLE domain-containing protein [Acidimicrobiales bacterium]
MTLPGGVSRVDGERDAGKRTWFWVAGLVVTLLLAAGVSQLASSEPDGLERVAEDEGFSDAAEEHDLAGSPLADYGVEGVDDDRLGTALAGGAGVVVTLAVGGGIFWLARRRSSATHH